MGGRIDAISVTTGEDGSRSVALSQAYTRGRSSSSECSSGGSSVISQLRLFWRSTLCCCYPAPRPQHVPVGACCHRLWHQSRGIHETLWRALMLPHQRHRKEMFTSVTVIIFFHLLTFIKKKRHTQAWGVTDTVTPGEWKSDCRWALCLLLFISLLNYSCYPRWPRSPMSDFTAWLLLQGHRWSYMCYLWSHAVLSDFALMQVITSAWL